MSPPRRVPKKKCVTASTPRGRISRPNPKIDATCPFRAGRPNFWATHVCASFPQLVLSHRVKWQAYPKQGLQRTGFLQVRFFYGFFNIPETLWIGDNMVFYRVFNCFITKQRNVTDSSTACLSVADVAGCATWAAGLRAATLAVDLLLTYYMLRAQLVESAQDTTAELLCFQLERPSVAYRGHLPSHPGAGLGRS
jgi:hypothetical protein